MAQNSLQLVMEKYLKGFSICSVANPGWHGPWGLMPWLGGVSSSVLFRINQGDSVFSYHTFTTIQGLTAIYHQALRSPGPAELQHPFSPHTKGSFSTICPSYIVSAYPEGFVFPISPQYVLKGNELPCFLPLYSLSSAESSPRKAEKIGSTSISRPQAPLPLKPSCYSGFFIS